MRWLNIKQYVIPQNTTLIFRVKNNDGDITFQTGELISNGETYFVQFTYDSCVERYITHFCVPDPVEIDKGQFN